MPAAPAHADEGALSGCESGRRVASLFRAELARGVGVPLPGGGETATRHRYLEGVAARDLALARLVEGHLDAVAILAEAARPIPDGAILGVWAARAPANDLAAARTSRGWRLRGSKPYASGASTLTHALVTAATPDGPQLFLIETHGAVEVVAGTWQAIGMQASDSSTVEIETTVARADAIGEPGWYTARAGFWHGSVGVAACWLGGARAVALPLRAVASPHARAHLGAVDAGIAAAAALLDVAAREIDEAPGVGGARAELRARRVRAVIEQAASDTLTRVGRALGAGPLCHDAEHAQRVADLEVYLRQSHAEADLERLGQLVGEVP
jgi:alkylation response protein AidB-like acyl-CoA dehydrogenase